MRVCFSLFATCYKCYDMLLRCCVPFNIFCLETNTSIVAVAVLAADRRCEVGRGDSGGSAAPAPADAGRRRPTPANVASDGTGTAAVVRPSRRPTLADPAGKCAATEETAQ